MSTLYTRIFWVMYSMCCRTPLQYITIVTIVLGGTYYPWCTAILIPVLDSDGLISLAQHHPLPQGLDDLLT